MDLSLTAGQLELRDRARGFTREVLRPLELDFETTGGWLEPDVARDVKSRAMQANLHGGSFPRELGGQGWTVLEQVLVHEQFGQVTGGLWSLIPGGYNVLLHCDVEQRHRYLEPCLRGERNGSYAVTEAGSGSDARTLEATAEEDPVTGDYILNGEKWFVTGPADTDFMIFHCNVVRGDTRRPTLFLVVAARMPAPVDAVGVEHRADGSSRGVGVGRPRALVRHHRDAARLRVGAAG